MTVTKAHCFFEQSGTFKNEFIKLGIPAEDYDIQNNFGETDHVVDLFKEIDDAYEGKEGTVFDKIGGATSSSHSTHASTSVPCPRWRSASDTRTTGSCPSGRRWRRS